MYFSICIRDERNGEKGKWKEWAAVKSGDLHFKSNDHSIESNDSLRRRIPFTVAGESDGVRKSVPVRKPGTILYNEHKAKQKDEKTIDTLEYFIVDSIIEFFVFFSIFHFFSFVERKRSQTD